MIFEMRTEYIVIAALITNILAYLWFADYSTRDALEEWQRESGYSIVNKQFRAFSRGPFLFSSNMQVVYRLTLDDKKGRRRKAWACCGSWFSGTLIKPVQVKVALDDFVEEPSTLSELL